MSNGSDVSLVNRAYIQFTESDAFQDWARDVAARGGIIHGNPSDRFGHYAVVNGQHEGQPYRVAFLALIHRAAEPLNRWGDQSNKAGERARQTGQTVLEAADDVARETVDLTKLVAGAIIVAGGVYVGSQLGIFGKGGILGSKGRR